MTSPAVDELTALRAALGRGDWRRLADPALDLALVARPDLWPAIVHRCARSLAAEALEGRDAADALLTWGRATGSATVVSVEITLRHSLAGTITPGRMIRSLLGGLPDEARAGAARSLARSVVARHPTTERQAALAVLDRWPA